MKACSIDITSRCFIIVCLHTTEAGGYIGSDPMIKLEREIVTPVVLGEAVLKVLGAPQKVFSIPVDFKALTERLVQFSGFKSWRSMYNATHAECIVEEKDQNNLKITVLSEKEKGAFLPGTKKPMDSNKNAEAIGSALFRAFNIN